jgi:hypothetical protein
MDSGLTQQASENILIVKGRFKSTSMNLYGLFFSYSVQSKSLISIMLLFHHIQTCTILSLILDGKDMKRLLLTGNGKAISTTV